MPSIAVTEGPGGLLEFPGALADAAALLAFAKELGGWWPTANAAFTHRHAYMRTVEMSEPAVAPYRALVETGLLPACNARWHLSLREHLPQVHLVRYQPGETYPPHFDHLGTPERFFSLICYLNDDYQGGGTVFQDLRHRVEPRAGKVILFPSHYCHYPEDVASGTKYVAVTFLLGSRPRPRHLVVPVSQDQ